MNKGGIIFIIVIGAAILMAAILGEDSTHPPLIEINRQGITNTAILEHEFLPGMYGDNFFPKHLVTECEVILWELCRKIEASAPEDLDSLYQITDGSTQEFNSLAWKFMAQGSDFETVARELVAMEFAFIAASYGFDADIETLIRKRTW